MSLPGFGQDSSDKINGHADEIAYKLHTNDVNRILEFAEPWRDEATRDFQTYARVRFSSKAATKISAHPETNKCVMGMERMSNYARRCLWS
jgi:hypothetical protein